MINVRGFVEPVEIYRISQADSKNIHTILEPQDPLTARRRISLGTILLTIFGVPCAVATTLSPLAIALGIGSLMGAIGPFFHLLDAMQIRIPLQIFSVLGATINLYVIQQSKLQQKLPDALPLTLFEKRKIKWMTALSLISLAAVAYEIYVHIFVLGMPYLSPSL